MAERHEAEMEALVSEEKVVADLLEARAAEVKEVRDGWVGYIYKRLSGLAYQLGPYRVVTQSVF